MRHGVVFSSLLVASLAQAAPAVVARAARPVRVATPKVEAGPPALATPNGQVMDRARELAEADLAPAPAEEQQPVRIEIGASRRSAGGARRPAATMANRQGTVTARAASARMAPTSRASATIARSTQTIIPAATRPQLAEAKPSPVQAVAGRAADPAAQASPTPAPSPRSAEPVPVLAAATPAHAAAALAEHASAGDDGPRPDYALAERIVRESTTQTEATAGPAAAETAAPVETASIERGADASQEHSRLAEAQPTPTAPEPATETMATGREATASVSPADIGVPEQLASRDTEESAEGPPASASDMGEDRQRLADADDLPDSPADRRDIDSEMPPVPDDPYDRAAGRGYRRAPDYGERWAARDDGGSCDGGRFAGLARAVRRAAQLGAIDPRTADDMEDEIAHGEDMQQSYCATGLNDWRAERLEAQYAQIEDRLRYERGR